MWRRLDETCDKYLFRTGFDGRPLFRTKKKGGGINLEVVLARLQRTMEIRGDNTRRFRGLYRKGGDPWEDCSRIRTEGKKKFLIKLEPGICRKGTLLSGSLLLLQGGGGAKGGWLLRPLAKADE